MKSRISLEGILSILLLLSIASGLIVTEYFYNPVSSALYSFTISSLIFVTATVFFLSKDRKTPEFKAPILVFCLWFSYVFVGYLTNKTGALITIYMFVLYLLLRSTAVLFSSLKFKFKPFFYGIIIVSTIESLYCILQSVGICKSHSLLFPVTGSYNNPNVTAIFLALTTPVFFYFFSKKFKWLIRVSFFILLIALLLLKCRAAFIGAIISVVVLKEYIRQKFYL